MSSPLSDIESFVPVVIVVYLSLVSALPLPKATGGNLIGNEYKELGFALWPESLSIRIPVESILDRLLLEFCVWRRKSVRTYGSSVEGIGPEISPKDGPDRAVLCDNVLVSVGYR